MKYCRNCGKEIDENAFVCPNCGVLVNEKKCSGFIKEDKGGFGWGLLGFLVPVIGLFLYLIWKDDKPLTAKAIGLGAIIALVTGIVLTIITYIIALAVMPYAPI